MFERSKTKRHRSGSSTETSLVEPQRHQRSRSIQKRLLIPVWLLVISNFVFLIVGVSFLGKEAGTAEADLQFNRTLSKTAYQLTIEDAAFHGPERVTHQLQPIEKNHLLKWQTFENESWVKVLVWVSETDYQSRFKALDKNREKASEFKEDDLQKMSDELPSEFVTLVPQVRDFCRRLPNDANQQVDYRLKQYLGLNPNSRYDRMVELWVPPRDLFRPCPDPETNDRFCQLSNSRGPATVPNIEDYEGFLRKLSIDYYQPEGRPWTRLGYTYDWAYGAHGVGASEYMMVPSARYRVAGSKSTDEYCQNLK